MFPDTFGKQLLSSHIESIGMRSTVVVSTIGGFAYGIYAQPAYEVMPCAALAVIATDSVLYASTDLVPTGMAVEPAVTNGRKEVTV